MKDDLDRDLVQSLLERHGFVVNPIPETTNRTPDLRVVMPGNDVIVEVKAKDDDQQVRSLVESRKGDSLSYNTASIETCLRDAWRQIRDFPARGVSEFTLVWFITRKPHSVTVLVKLSAKSILYGAQLLSGQRTDGRHYEVSCCSFNYSFFFKRKDVDGVVLYDDESLELCLNPYSPHLKELRTTKLTNLFRNHYSLIDPIQLEAEGKAFIADCEIPRQDKNGIVSYIKGKYGLKTVAITYMGPLGNLPVD